MTTPFNFGPMMEAHAGRFTVGFVAPEKDRAHLLGSGTLVRFGEIAGVLTCAHVLEVVVARAEFGVLCFPVRPGDVQTFRVRRDLTQAVPIGERPWNEQGPDLAFLRLPEGTMADLERVGSVVDGMRHRANALAAEPDTPHVANLVCGVIDERTQPSVIRGNVAVTPFESLINPGQLIEKSEAQGMDLYRFRPVPGEGAILPTTYEGTSGGGLWRFYLRLEEDGTYSLTQSRLVGVAFWEKKVGDELHLVCHGQRSLYHVLFARIRAECR